MADIIRFDILAESDQEDLKSVSRALKRANTGNTHQGDFDQVVEESMRLFDSDFVTLQECIYPRLENTFKAASLAEECPSIKIAGDLSIFFSMDISSLLPGVDWTEEVTYERVDRWKIGLKDLLYNAVNNIEKREFVAKQILPAEDAFGSQIYQICLGGETRLFPAYDTGLIFSKRFCDEMLTKLKEPFYVFFLSTASIFVAPVRGAAEKIQDRILKSAYAPADELSETVYLYDGSLNYHGDMVAYRS